MYKIIDLGIEFSSTGEPRARILDTSLVKTASSEIQEYWDKLERNDKYAYLWVIGVSAMEYYGCNNNGDAFAEADLKKTIPDWAKNAHIFVHHVNKDPRKSIGKPVYAWYNDEMHRVELILAIDRSANGASSIVDRITRGEQMYVSMGCNVAYDVCSICGHQSKTRAEYCDHLRFNMKRILPDGRQVYAFNPNPRFFDISIVTRPADPTAFALDKLASEEAVQYLPPSSAELGEAAEDLMLKAAAVHKLADIIKQVDGRVVDTKVDPEVMRVRDIASCGFKDFDYPVMPYRALDAIGASPIGFMTALRALGAPMTLADAYWMSGLSRAGIGLAYALGRLPYALSVLGDCPEKITPIIHQAFLSAQDVQDPVRMALTVSVTRPVALQRIEIVKSIPMLKVAEFGHRQSMQENSNFTPIHISDEYGNVVRTSAYYLNQAKGAGLPWLKKGAGGLLLMAALGSLILAPDLISKIVGAGATGLPAAMLLADSDKEKTYVSKSTGQEFPAQLITQAWKQPIAKTAAAAVSFGTAAGMAAPAAIALDYAYNKWRSYRNGEPAPSGPMESLGKVVLDHPATTVFTGGVAGTMLHSGLKKLLKRR